MPRTKTLAERARLVFERADRFKTTRISASMATPLDDNAAANALAIYLLRRSCKEYPDFSLLNGRLDELYGASLSAGVSKIGDAQVLTLSITCVNDRFAPTDESVSENCAELLANLIFSPNVKNGGFGAEALATEKRLLIRRVEEEFNDKTTYAINRCVEYMCENEPCGRPKYGSKEEIQAVKGPKVYEAWKRLLSTAVFQATAVGGADEEKISEIFKNRFAKITRAPIKPETIFTVKSGRFGRREESYPVNQGKLVVGFRAGTRSSRDDIYAATVANDIFGGGVYSKLFVNVREKLSLAYFCKSRFIANKGIILVAAGIDSDKEKKASAEILSQLSDLRNGKFEPETLEASKLSLKERFTLATPESVGAWYSSQILEDETVTPESMIEGVEKVTIEDVCAAAKRFSIDSIFMLKSKEAAEINEN